MTPLAPTLNTAERNPTEGARRAVWPLASSAAILMALAGCTEPGVDAPPAAAPVVSVAPVTAITESLPVAKRPESPPSTPALPAYADDQQPSDRLLARTFDDIKFDIEPDAPYDRSMLTEAIEQLDGQRIRIRGYMLPTPRNRGIKQFILVRDNEDCCFGPGAALYDCILIEMLPGRTTEYARPSQSIAVEGKFHVSEFLGPYGRPLAIYRIDGEEVDR